MKNWILILFAALIVTGCACKQQTVSNVEQPRAPLKLSDPAALHPMTPEWVVITPANAEQAFRELKAKGKDPVLFGLTDTSYEQLSIDFAEMRNFIVQQRKITEKYRNYYEPEKQPEPNK